MVTKRNASTAEAETSVSGKSHTPIITRQKGKNNMLYNFIIHTNDSEYDPTVEGHFKPLVIVAQVETDSPEKVIQDSYKFGDEYRIFGSTAVPYFKVEKVTWEAVE